MPLSSKSFREPIRIGKFELPNRVAAAPMATRSFGRDGLPTEKTLAIYEKYAASGAAMAVIEHHAVHPWGRNRMEQPRLYEDRYAEALKPLTAPFREKGMPVLAQISCAGALTADASLLDESDFEYVSPSGDKTPRDVLQETPRALERGQIAELVEAFVASAVRAVRIAGYDGVQIHAAHGYLLGQFLSPLTNRRADEYGGSEKKRARLLYEITDAIRATLPDALLSVRLGMADYMPGEPLRGLSVDETAPIARELAALGADWLGLSGNHCGFGDQIAADTPFFAPFARVVHDALRGATFSDCAGGVRSAQTANDLLSGGVCDLVGVGRLFWSNPDFLQTWD